MKRIILILIILLFVGTSFSSFSTMHVSNTTSPGIPLSQVVPTTQTSSATFTYNSESYYVNTGTLTNGSFKITGTNDGTLANGSTLYTTANGYSQMVNWTDPSGTSGFAFSWSATTGLYNIKITVGSYSTTISGPTSGSTINSISTDQNAYFNGSLAIQWYNTPTITISWSIQNLIVYETTNPSTQSSTGTITENVNWFNTSSAYSWNLNDPSGALNGASVDGETWNTIIQYTVSNLLESGYQANINDFYVGSSTNLVDTSTGNQYYNSYSGTLTNVFSLSLNTWDFVNYYPSSPTLSTSFSGIGSQANLNIVTSEQLTGEMENIQINWGDGTITNLNGV